MDLARLHVRDKQLGHARALIFVVLLFSPIVYPASNQPAWLVWVHEVLPFYSHVNRDAARLVHGIEHADRVRGLHQWIRSGDMRT